MTTDARVKTVKEFWAAIDRRDFNAAGALMTLPAEVRWPNTGELIRGRDPFVTVQKRYPGRWRIDMEKLLPAGDTIVTVVRVSAEDQSQGFFATSFFEFEGSLIAGITEYWGDIGQPPEWRTREGLSVRY